MINGVDYHYLNKHPEEYKRLTADRLDDDAVIGLVEVILNDVREEYVHAAKALRASFNKENIIYGNSLLRYLRGPYIDALTCGHGDEIARVFLGMCPEKIIHYGKDGVGYFEYQRKDDWLAKQKRRYIGGVIAGVRGKSNAVGNVGSRRCYASKYCKEGSKGLRPYRIRKLRAFAGKQKAG